MALGAIFVVLALAFGVIQISTSWAALGNGGEPQAFCWAHNHGLLTDSYIVLQNSTDLTVTISRVQLYKASGIAIIAADVGPVSPTWPTDGEPFPPAGKLWSQRHAAAGYVIRPGKSTALIIGLKRTASTGRFDAVDVLYTSRVWYKFGTGHQKVREANGVVLSAGSSCP